MDFDEIYLDFDEIYLDLRKQRIYALEATSFKSFLHHAKKLCRYARSRMDEAKARYHGEKFLEYVDFLLSFERYKQAQEMLGRMSLELAPRTGLRQAICFLRMGERDQARQLIRDLLASPGWTARDLLPLIYLSSVIVGDEPDIAAWNRLDPKFKCMIDLRRKGAVADSLLAELADFAAKENLLFGELIATAPGGFGTDWRAWLDFFPEDPAFQILLLIHKMLNREAADEFTAEEVRKALYRWPELWCMLFYDPVFESTDELGIELLPTPDGGRLQLWAIHQVAPVANHGCIFELGDFCPESWEVWDSPLFDLRDSQGSLDIFRAEKPRPPFFIEMRQRPDRIFGPYSDVLETIQGLAARAEDIWFFVHDINKAYVDEIIFRDHQFGIRRWWFDPRETDPDLPLVSPENYLNALISSGEARFQSGKFQAFVRIAARL